MQIHNDNNAEDKKAVLSQKTIPRDAGHLYRKLAPNPRTTQWI